MHTGGVTETPAPPQRVACLTPLGELEALLTFGVAPVQIGVRSFTEEFLRDPLALWPWQQAALDAIGENPERVSADTLPSSAAQRGR